MIVKCGCNYPPQDKLHGKGNRVANPTKETNPAKVRCTVCKALVDAKHETQSAPIKEATKG